MASLIQRASVPRASEARGGPGTASGMSLPRPLRLAAPVFRLLPPTGKLCSALGWPRRHLVRASLNGHGTSDNAETPGREQQPAPPVPPDEAASIGPVTAGKAPASRWGQPAASKPRTSAARPSEEAMRQAAARLAEALLGPLTEGLAAREAEREARLAQQGLEALAAASETAAAAAAAAADWEERLAAALASAANREEGMVAAAAEQQKRVEALLVAAEEWKAAAAAAALTATAEPALKVADRDGRVAVTLAAALEREQGLVAALAAAEAALVAERGKTRAAATKATELLEEKAALHRKLEEVQAAAAAASTAAAAPRPREEVVTEANVRVGMRVVRGPDWEYGNEDGGKGGVGTVLERNAFSGSWVVYWKASGYNICYHLGYGGKYALRVAPEQEEEGLGDQVSALLASAATAERDQQGLAAALAAAEVRLSAVEAALSAEQQEARRAAEATAAATSGKVAEVLEVLEARVSELEALRQEERSEYSEARARQARVAELEEEKAALERRLSESQARCAGLEAAAASSAASTTHGSSSSSTGGLGGRSTRTAAAAAAAAASTAAAAPRPREEVVTAANVRVGMRVVRGPDWEYGDEDGGEGGVGMVVERSVFSGSWEVHWKASGYNICYHVGYGGKYALRVAPEQEEEELGDQSEGDR